MKLKLLWLYFFSCFEISKFIILGCFHDIWTLLDLNLLFTKPNNLKTFAIFLIYFHWNSPNSLFPVYASFFFFWKLHLLFTKWINVLFWVLYFEYIISAVSAKFSKAYFQPFKLAS